MDPLELKYLFEDIEENTQYENYLTTHIQNVGKGYQWFKENLPELLSEDNYVNESAYYGELDEIIAQHDGSKYTKITENGKSDDGRDKYTLKWTRIKDIK